MSDGSGPLTQVQALALVQRTTDPGWFTGMQDSPDGQAILNEMAAPLAEASKSVMDQVAACAIATAPAGRQGQCDLYLTRADTATALLIPRGFLFVDSRGVQLVLREDVTVAVGQASIYLPLVTVRQLDLLNNTEPAFDDVLAPGDTAGAIVAGTVVGDGVALGPSRFLITASVALTEDGYYDLALAPPGFWDAVRTDGGDVRVATSDGRRCAVDIVGFDSINHWGALFFNANSATVFVVYYGSGEPAPLPSSQFGSQSVWSASARAMYHLEDLNDATAQAHNLSGATPPTVSDYGKIRKAMMFDGADDYAISTDDPDFRPSAFTLCAWMRPTGLQPQDTHFRRLLVKNYTDAIAPPYVSFGLVFNAAGDHLAGLHSDMNGDASVSTAVMPVTPDVWQWVALSFDGATMTIYRDGIAHASHAGLGAISYSTGGLLSGRSFPGAALGRYNGQLDETRLYNRALSPTEIAQLYANQNAPSTFWTTLEYGLPESVTYVSSTPIVGAESDWLSAHGDERGCKRQPGEDGEAYRLRVRSIPNAATPVAIQNAVHGAQSQADLPTVHMVEPMRDQASDAARAEIDLAFADSLFFDEGFLDDPLGVDLPGKLPWRTCEMPSNREARAYFRLGVAGELLEPDGSVWYWDAGYFDDPAWGFPDAGMHPTLVASLRAIQESARVKVAGGVQFDTYVECVNRIDLAGEGLPTRAFTVSAAPGTVWLLREGLVTVTVNGEPINPALDSYRVDITLADGSVIVSGFSRACDGMPLRTFELERIGYRSQPVAQIAVIVQGVGLDPVRAIGTFWVTPMSL